MCLSQSDILSFSVLQSSIVVQKLLTNTSVRHTDALGDMFLHYHEHTHHPAATDTL